MKKIIVATLTAASLVALPVSAQQVLRLSHNAAAGNPKADASLLFAKLVEEKTEGRIKVEVGGSAQYGDDLESLTNMRLGTLAFSANSQGTTSTVVPQFAVIGLPFMFRDLDHAYAVVDGPAGEKLSELARDKGLEVLAFWDNGIRHVSNNKRPIVDPEDLAGIKLRTPPDPMTMDIFSALGANPMTLAFSELYIALQQGVVDGQENPFMNIYSSKLHEVQKYISLTGHKYETTPVLASKIVFDRFSDEDKKLIKEAAIEAGVFNRQKSREADENLRATFLAAGVEINDINRDAFVAKMQPVYDKWSGQYPELVELVRGEAERL
ncbi:MAG: TRAP transporter substrate-binding protein [Paenalcaligenes sp.]